jgi:hypothetical protein
MKKKRDHVHEIMARIKLLPEEEQSRFLRTFMQQGHQVVNRAGYVLLPEDLYRQTMHNAFRRGETHALCVNRSQASPAQIAVYAEICRLREQRKDYKDLQAHYYRKTGKHASKPFIAEILRERKKWLGLDRLRDPDKAHWVSMLTGLVLKDTPNGEPPPSSK